jgi:hypothetical protein
VLSGFPSGISKHCNLTAIAPPKKQEKILIVQSLHHSNCFFFNASKDFAGVLPSGA